MLLARRGLIRALGTCLDMELDNTIIYLIGIPAVGKYTVAKEIGRMTGARVVDNQLINTPVFSVLGYDGTDAFPFPHGAWAQIEKVILHGEVIERESLAAGVK